MDCFQATNSSLRLGIKKGPGDEMIQSNRSTLAEKMLSRTVATRFSGIRTRAAPLKV